MGGLARYPSEKGCWIQDPTITSMVTMQWSRDTLRTPEPEQKLEVLSSLEGYTEIKVDGVTATMSL
jgi:hypothetical protein